MDNNYTATYSPEDNKLRLYASARLDTETYARVKSSGFIWAPKQQLFVAPTWTPERADLLIELADEIGDEDTSLVERAEERADRFDDYSASRAKDAHTAKVAVDSICDGIPLGQPILVGHHSERHARKDAERIQSGMRKAVKMWETSQYWKSRAVGAIRAAKYKELPAVRARRIKGLEADKRKQEAYIKRSQDFTEAWSKSLAYDPEIRRLTREQARAIANYDRACSGMCFPLKDYPRNPPASQYEGAMGLWSALGDSDEEAIITPEQACDFALRSHARTIAHAARWLEHINNRLEYERAMLTEGGGLNADAFDIAIGGQVKRRGEWFVVVKLNKRNGVLGSVTVSGHWATTIPVEDIQDYQPPAEGDTETVTARMKQSPLCNFRSEDCIEMTAAEWKQKSSWGDAWAVRKFTAEGEYVWRGATAYRHRSRYSLGDHRTGTKVFRVFLTDCKVVEPPTTTPAKPEPVQRIVEAPLARSTRRAQSLELVHECQFYKSESGKILGGIKYEYAGEGVAECYQYDTVAALIEAGRACEAQPRLLRYSIVTHSGEYENMAAVYSWERDKELFEGVRQSLRGGVQIAVAPQLFPTPIEIARRMIDAAEIKTGQRILEPSAGTGNILDAIRAAGIAVVTTAVEINYDLVSRLRARFDDVRQADFLTCNGELGKFDVVVMNPPFASAQDIRHIQHALTMLNPGGRLVALCANGPRQQEQLRPLGEWIELPAGSFKEAGTNVNVAMLIVRS